MREQLEHRSRLHLRETRDFPAPARGGASPRHSRGRFFLPEHKRVYPNGVAAAHVLGYANVDNEGIAGIEKMD